VRRRLTTSPTVVLAVVAVAAAGFPAVPAGAVSESDKLEAEVAKLNAETKKLKGDNGLLARLPGYGALVAAAVALAGVYVTRRQQLDDERKHKDDALAQSERESIRRFDEQFTQIVANLTAAAPDVRASAAVSIRAFLKPEHERFHEQVVSLVSANLKFPRGDVTDRILGSTYAQALQDHGGDLRALCGPGGPDLFMATLQRANLSGLDLSGTDMFKANLHGSDLSEAKLVNANARYADLSSATFKGADLEAAQIKWANLKDASLGEARLVSTKLQKAKAQNARFNGAKLQDAIFDDADLREASFREANLNNAFFRGAQFDEPALRSILEAENWQKANFDPPVLARLEEMEAGG
jgi:uncharacterized protein YjbI with pentapeptide repeats